MPYLEIRDLVKSFDSPEGGRVTVIDVPEFDLEAGEQAALRGASGVGKTTLLNLIAGILRADGGSIRLDGHDLAALGEGARDRLRADRIGYIFQTFNLLQGFTALENVELGAAFGGGGGGGGGGRGAARELLERVGLGDRLHYRPAQLSIGQQQRVAVARALANAPGLVLADEPTGNLDPDNAREALALIREVCRERGAALLLVSHDADTLDSFDRVVDLRELNAADGRERISAK